MCSGDRRRILHRDEDVLFPIAAGEDDEISSTPAADCFLEIIRSFP